MLDMIEEEVFDGELVKEDVGTGRLIVSPNYRNIALVCKQCYTRASDALFLRMHTHCADTPVTFWSWLGARPHAQRKAIRSLEFGDDFFWNCTKQEPGLPRTDTTVHWNPPAWFNAETMSFKKKGIVNLKKIHMQVAFDTGMCPAFACSPERREGFRREIEAAMQAWIKQLQSWNPGVDVSIRSDSIRLREEELSRMFVFLPPPRP